jgi:hypothetical protein
MSLDPLQLNEECDLKYEKVVVSDDSNSDEDEPLEVVIQKVNSRTPASEAAKSRPPPQRMLTPQRVPRPIVVKPKLSGANPLNRRIFRSQLGTEDPVKS